MTAPSTPRTPTTQGLDPAAFYAQTDDSRSGLLIGAALALVLHTACLLPVLLGDRAASLTGAIKPSVEKAGVDQASLQPKAMVSPAPLASNEKVVAPEGDVSVGKLPTVAALLPSKRTTTDLVKRTPAPPPPPTTAPAGMNKASAITMAWISAEAFEAMVAEKGRVEQAGFQRMATPTPGAPMRTDPVPAAAQKENAGGELAMQGAPGQSMPEAPPASVAKPVAKPTEDTKGPPPAQGMGADRVVQLEGKANEAPMKTSTPQGVTWEEPAVKTGPLVMGDVLPGQGKAADQQSSAPRLGAQRGNIAAAPQPTMKEAPNPTPDGMGQLSPGFVESQAAVKEVTVSPAQPSVAPPTVVGKPVVPLKNGAGEAVPLGDSQVATDQVSNQKAQRVGDRAQEARREVLPQVGQAAREAKPVPTGTANDAKSPPRPGIADDVLVEGTRSTQSVTLSDKVSVTGGKDDHSAGDGSLAMVVPNPKIDDAAPAHTAPERPGIGSDRLEKPSEKSPDPNAKTPAPQSQNTPASPPMPQGRPSAVAQGAEHGGDKARVSSLPKSDRESPPVSMSPEPIKLKPGAVLVGEGIEIRTVLPRLSIIAQVTSLPANPEVKVTFARTGKVINAEMIRSTGYPNWDGPILSSLYLWTVKGERFEKINGPVEFKFVILITD